MKLLPALCCCLLASGAPAFEIDELFDRLDAALTVAAFHDNFRARLSGTIDLEFYNFEQPAPGLIDSSSDNLFNPRLTLFLDGPDRIANLFLYAGAAGSRVRSQRPGRPGSAR